MFAANRVLPVVLAGILFLGLPTPAAPTDQGVVDSLAEVPELVVLSDSELEAIQGGCLSCRITCAALGSAAALASGNPAVGVFVALACMELLDPAELS